MLKRKKWQTHKLKHDTMSGSAMLRREEGHRLTF
jgi:hypothetical protein